MHLLTLTQNIDQMKETLGSFIKNVMQKDMQWY